MPRGRIPNEMHRRRGSLDPSRHKTGAPAGDPVGDPPPYMDSRMREVWAELAASAPWIGPSDRGALEVAARALDALRRSPGADASPALIGQVRAALDSIGLSPKSRGALGGLPAWPGAPVEDGLEREFFGE
jgi:hypothetical protein